jgi:hypothetical protein
MSARGKASKTGRRIDADAVRALSSVMAELHIISSKPMLLICRFAPTGTSVTPSRDRDGARHLLAAPALTHAYLGKRVDIVGTS